MLLLEESESEESARHARSLGALPRLAALPGPCVLERGKAMSMTEYRRGSGWVKDFGGVIVATCTPFDDGGALALDRVPPYVDFLLERGVAALMVGGTTSEFIALSLDERSSLIAATVHAVSGRAPVVAHVGDVALGPSIRLARDAVEVGASAVAAIVPYFHHYTEQAIVGHLRAVARAVPELPVFVYNYPAATGNRLTVDGFALLLEEENVAGMKLSMATFEEIEPFLRFLPDICVVSGNDGVWRQFSDKGGRAVVSGNAAALPELMVAVLDAYLRDDKEVIAPLEPLVGEVIRLTRGGQPAVLKALLRSRGMPIGGARVASVASSELAGALEPSDALRAAIGWDVSTATKVHVPKS